MLSHSTLIRATVSLVGAEFDVDMALFILNNRSFIAGMVPEDPIKGGPGTLYGCRCVDYFDNGVESVRWIAKRLESLFPPLESLRNDAHLDRIRIEIALFDSEGTAGVELPPELLHTICILGATIHVVVRSKLDLQDPYWQFG